MSKRTGHDDVVSVVLVVGGCFWAVIGFLAIGIGGIDVLMPYVGRTAAGIISTALAILNGYVSLRVASAAMRLGLE